MVAAPFDRIALTAGNEESIVKSTDVVAVRELALVAIGFRFRVMELSAEAWRAKVAPVRVPRSGSKRGRETLSPTSSVGIKPVLAQMGSVV
jgi:hypothetical protein